MLRATGSAGVNVHPTRILLPAAAHQKNPQPVKESDANFPKSSLKVLNHRF